MLLRSIQKKTVISIPRLRLADRFEGGHAPYDLIVLNVGTLHGFVPDFKPVKDNPPILRFLSVCGLV